MEGEHVPLFSSAQVSYSDGRARLDGLPTRVCAS